MEYQTFSRGICVATHVSQDGLEWWSYRFGLYQMLPRDVCARLVKDVEFPPQFYLTRYDDNPRLARFEIDSFDEDGEIFRTERDLCFDAGVLHQCFLHIRESLQGSGIGTLFARNCYRLAEQFGFSRLRIHAVEGGGYYWARAGFLPYPESWEHEYCKPRILKRLRELDTLPVDVIEQVEEFLKCDEPETIWEIASLNMLVPSKYHPGFRVKLGRSLLGESGCSWHGSIEFGDNDLHSEQHARASHYMCLDGGG